ncbi:unnamed protein product [Peniophora sp. CBMAI 1063]|nr:unnamed protein product [Peniophora sp. CBMAI 1063]
MSPLSSLMPDADAPALDTAGFPDLILVLEALQQVYPSELRAIVDLLKHWVDLDLRGDFGPRFTDYPSRLEYEPSVDAGIRVLVDGMIRDSPNLPGGLDFLSTLFSASAVRIVLARQAFGGEEPGVNVVDNARLRLQPVLQLTAFFVPRCRDPMYSGDVDDIAVFLVTISLALSALAQYAPFRFYAHFYVLSDVVS